MNGLNYTIIGKIYCNWKIKENNFLKFYLSDVSAKVGFLCCKYEEGFLIFGGRDKNNNLSNELYYFNAGTKNLLFFSFKKNKSSIF